MESLPTFIILLSVSYSVDSSGFYRHSAVDIRSNEEVKFTKYRGKVVVVVNVASECGYTESNYQDLVQLHKKFPEDSFAILAFPCNDFGNQEPRANRHIWRYVDERFQVNFDLFNKVKCVGDKAHSLFRWLKKGTANQEATWNFSKYLINQEGEVVRFASAWVSPLDLVEDIERLLEGRTLQGGVFSHENIVEKTQHSYRDDLYYKDEL